MTKTINISANPSQPCTFASRTSQRTDQSLQKSMSAPTQEKIQNIFSYPSKKIKTPDTQADTTKTVKLNNDNGLQTWWTRTTGYNKVLPKAGLNGFDWIFVQGSTCILRLNFCANNPRLRQYPNRRDAMAAAVNRL
ncbi:MAG: hypothetical protein LC128_06685 [Chitinophagales bacterium]|nr:hypothetical protein [Chitinophagales bacterium]